MKSRTSFFNLHVLKKNMTRFAPVWALYSVAAVLFVVIMNAGNNPRYFADTLIESLGSMAIYRSIHALIVAACLFGDLFDSRMCNGLHAMPLRREGWLFTNLISGILFALIPALIGGGTAALLLGQYAWVAWVWQGTNLLFFLFFFAVAVFSAMCAGKRLGMAAIYVILNFASLLVYWVIVTIYQPLLYGTVFSDAWFIRLCPLVNLVANEYVQTGSYQAKNFAVEAWIGKDWNYLWSCAGIGILLYAASFLVYRKRKLETAGDFVSFRVVRFLFMLAYTFALGTFLFAIGDAIVQKANYLFLAVGIVIGYFTGWMLLERTVKVFTSRILLGFVIFGLLLAGSIGLTIWDPLGVQSYIPPTEQIVSASLYPEGNRSYQDDAIDMNYSGWYITDPEEIAQVQDLHSRILSEPDDTIATTVTVNVQYRLKNGNRIFCIYQIPKHSTEYRDISAFLVDIRPGVQSRDWEIVTENIREVFIENVVGNKPYTIQNPEQYIALMKALSLDAQAGTMSKSNQAQYLRRNDVLLWEIQVYWIVPTKYDEIFGETIRIYEDCVNTVAFLETLQSKS